MAGQARSTTLAQAFSQKLLLEMYDKFLGDVVVNRDYQGEVNGVGSKINILNLDRISEKDYTGSNLTVDDILENNTTLTIEKQKSFYWRELTVDNWKSYLKTPHSTVVSQKADERAKNMDAYILGFYGDVAAGNRVGTDYTTGTVTVDVTTGAVTGSGTTFTSSMVGKGFKATGHTKWYRVKSYASATSIVIEDDLDDRTSAYTGGAIGAGASYIIEAATVVSITTTNLVQQVAALKLKIDKAEANGFSAVPDGDRWMIVPPEFEDVVVRATGIVLHVPEVYDNLIQKGMIGELLGFKLFRSNRLTGDNTNGYHVLAGHPNWLTFAEKLLEADIEEVLIGNFGSAYKDLMVYGGKVADKRRGFAAELFCTFST
jgi:hypothetical protein